MSLPTRRPLSLCLASALALLVPVAWAAEEQRESEKPAVEEEIEVSAEAPRVQSQSAPREALESARFTNVSQVFESLPGVAGVRRGASMVEPVIRGLGWERVQTQVNGTPLYGACPARMDPPACALSSCSVREARVAKSLASVTLGPAGTGGRLLISTSAQLRAIDEAPLSGALHLGWDAARDGLVGGVGAKGRSGALAYRAGVELMSYDDYESAEGITVPAGQEEQSAYASMAYAFNDEHSAWLSVTASDADDVDYPALPMNSEFVENRLYQVGYEFARQTGALASARAMVGVATTDHFMSNRAKPNRGMLEAETPSYADTTNARVALTWRVAPGTRLSTGADFVELERDARRERRIVMSGATFFDHLWPEVSQEDLGLFAELEAHPGSRWTLRAGLRYDDVRSEAAAADDPSLMMRSVRENYAFWYGEDALDTDRSEGLVSGNLLVERQVTPAMSAHVGLGVATRAASVTERYFAFAPAPGGFAVGNPTLDAEEKRELAAGLEFTSDALALTASVYYYDFADYIYSSLLDVRDINGDERPDLLRGYENVDATVYGFEAAASWRVSERWTLPLALAYVRAENDDAGRPLPEIPPFEARVAARYRFEGRLPGWVELGSRIVDDQTRIDETFGEDATESFELWHLRARVAIAERYELEIGVENLLDEDYNEHLTREALLPVGDLAVGDEVPQPGRHFVASLRARF